MYTERRVYRSLGYHSVAQNTVLGIAPGPFLVAECFASGRERIKLRLGIYQKVAVLFVMYQSSCIGVEIRGVANLVFIDPEIVMQKYTDLTGALIEVCDADPPKENIVMTCDRIAA